jgi:hypothetical protein
MSRHVSLEVVNRHCTYVRGYGSYDELVVVTGGKPVRSNIAKAWVVSERTALERLLPHLEHLGYVVTVTGSASSQVVHPEPLPAGDPVSEVAEDSGLW